MTLILVEMLKMIAIPPGNAFKAVYIIYFENSSVPYVVHSITQFTSSAKNIRENYYYFYFSRCISIFILKINNKNIRKYGKKCDITF